MSSAGSGVAQGLLLELTTRCLVQDMEIDNCYFEFVHPVDEEFVLSKPFFTIFIRNDGTDDKGRSLLEARSVGRKPPLKDLRSCPFRDSRSMSAKPMNFAAFQYFNQNKADVLAVLDAVLYHLRRRALGKWEQLTPIQRLNVFAYTGLRLPGYWSILYANELPAGRSTGVPCAVAILSKMCHGLLTLIWHILSRCPSESICGASADAEMFYRYADEKGILIGGSEVCSGPPRVIQSIIHRVIHRQSDPIIEGIETVESVLNKAVRYCRVAHYAEVVALLYGSMKLRVSAAQVAGRGDPLTLGAAGFIPTFSYFDVAITMLESERPLNHQTYRALDMAYWEDAEISTQIAVGALEDLYIELIQAEKCGGVDEGMWAVFQNGCLQSMNSLNSMLGGAVHRQTPLTCADLEVFFGRAPAFDVSASRAGTR